MYSMRNSSEKNLSRGATLIELLVMLLIIALLLIPPSVVASSQMKKARGAKRKANLNRIKTALYDYYFDNDSFPESLPDCGEKLQAGENVYLGNFPCDPQGGEYIFQTDPDRSSWFKVFANLENTQDADIDRVGCREGCGPQCQYNYGVASTNVKVSGGCDTTTFFACGPNGECSEFENPGLSQCPKVYENDPSCGGECDKKSPFKCHDYRGKKTPDN